MRSWLTVYAGFVIGAIAGKDLLHSGWITAALCAVCAVAASWDVYRGHLAWRSGMRDYRDKVLSPWLDSTTEGSG